MICLERMEGKHCHIKIHFPSIYSRTPLDYYMSISLSIQSKLSMQCTKKKGDTFFPSQVQAKIIAPRANIIVALSISTRISYQFSTKALLSPICTSNNDCTAELLVIGRCRLTMTRQWWNLSKFWSMKFVESNGNFNMAGKRVQECHHDVSSHIDCT